MATTLAEIRARLQASDNKPQGGNSSTGESVIYPHWNIAEGASTKIRFLPDADTNNTFFWVERSLIKLAFSGIKGDPSSRRVEIAVPCMEMYGRDTPCPILSEVRPWFKDPSLEVKGRQYWKKKSYLFQGFVRENPMTDDRAPANPIRRFIISPQIFNLVKSALMDPDLENLPTDYESGLDFTVTKGAKGGFADYSTSKWARKESSLTAAETAAIDQYGLFNLVDFLPKKPNDVELKVIKESSDRKECLSEMLKPLNREKASVMHELLENVQTDKLQSAFEKYLPAVLNNSVVKKSEKAVLSESRVEITGDKSAKTVSKDTNVIELKRLAGL